MKRLWIGLLAFLVVFLFIVMQVRVSDKDEQIGDLREQSQALYADKQALLEENKALRVDDAATAREIETLEEMNDVAVQWGECLERWGTQLTQGSPDAKVTKTRCDTYLAEIEKMFVEGS